MANQKRAYWDNAPGDFFVDDTCIDCDLCRQIAPSVFAEFDDHSAVHRQPESEHERLRAGMALVACPTGSIGSRNKIDLQRAVSAFPENVEENVYFCGFASPNSFGAASYLIQRPEGNVLIDSPRFARNLVQRLEAMGGVSMLFLTHRDDVADHQKFREHFGCRRVIHKDDARNVPAEWVLHGSEATRLDGDLVAVPAPGHTRGHAVLLYRDKYLFTGDHLAWSDRRGGLIAFRNATWYSWREQTQSMKRLLDLRFEWVLPGHGRRKHLSANDMHQSLVHCIDWMEKA